MAGLSLSDHRHNLTFNIIHEFFFGFGVAFHDLSTILPLFLTLLGAPISVAGSIAGMFSILIAAPPVDLRHNGPQYAKCKSGHNQSAFNHFAPYFPVWICLRFFCAHRAARLDILFISVSFFYALGIGFVIPIWSNF